MKKLMIAAAALTAGFAMADVVSSDIVGYAQNGLKFGATMATPQFVNVGAGVALDLQSLKATGDEASDNVQIQTLDAGGYTVDTYDWNDWANAEACWVDGDWNPVEGVTIQPGQGLWVMGSSSAQSIRFPAPTL